MKNIFKRVTTRRHNGAVCNNKISLSIGCIDQTEEHIRTSPAAEGRFREFPRIVAATAAPSNVIGCHKLMHNDMKHSGRNEYSQQLYAYLANIRSVMKYVGYLHRCAAR